MPDNHHGARKAAGELKALAAVSVFALLLRAGAARGELLPTLARGPYVQMATSDSVVIVWRTLGRTQPLLRYGEKPDRLQGEVRADLIRVLASPGPTTGAPAEVAKEDATARPLTDVPDGIYQYEAPLKGLKPLTTYYYGVCDGDRLLAGGDQWHCFRTSPAAGQPASVRFAAQSDSHGKGWHVVRMQQLLGELSEREGRPLDFLLHCGDIGSKGRDMEFQGTFEALADNMRNTTLWIAPGNHDTLAGAPLDRMPYTDAFVLPTQGEAGGAPSGTELYYSFDYGRVHVVSMPSLIDAIARTPDGAMAQWLKADLDKAKAEGKTDWVIAFFHSPIYESTWAETHQDSVEMRQHILPILEAGGVDLVFGGHLHIYERTVLIDGVYASQYGAAGVLDDGDGDSKGDGAYRKSAGLNPHEGTVAVITGHVGSPLMRSDGLHPLIRRAMVEVGTTLIDIEGDTLTARMVNIDGQVRDTFQIVKRGQVARRPPTKPRPGESFYFRVKLEGPRFALIPLVEGAVTLDGKPDEVAWQNALTTPPGKVFCGRDALYVAASVPEARGVAAKMTQRDSNLLQDNFSVDLLVDPRYDRKSFYYFATNSEGTQADGRNDDMSYNADWQVATRKAAGAEPWSMEMRIPWQALELPGPPGEKALMGMNLRVRWGSWSFSREWFRGRGDPRFIGVILPEEFGVVRFGAGRLEPLIKPYDAWSCLAGKQPPKEWINRDFDASPWLVGNAGFGYGDIDNTTPLPEMKGSYSTVYLRREFEVKDVKEISDLGLMIAYDDAFIAWLNGKEVLRVGVGSGRGVQAKRIAVHEGGLPDFSLEKYVAHIRRHAGAPYLPLPGVPVSPQYFPLKERLSLLREGKNVLAIEGHNASVASKAFTIDPQLLCIYKP